MLKARSRTKAISSSSSFKNVLALTFALLASCLPYVHSYAGDRPLKVDVPLETFARVPHPMPPLPGLLWLAGSQPEATRGKSVLLLHSLNGRKEDWTGYAEVLRGLGFNVLAIDLRGKGGLGKKSMIEDVQSGVIFLRSDQSKPKIESNGVFIIGSSIGANGAAHYAGASPQNYLILDGLVLLSPGEKYKDLSFLDALRSVKGIPILLVAAEKDAQSAETVKSSKDQCQARCESLFYPNDAHGLKLLETKNGAELKKAIELFLLKRNG